MAGLTARGKEGKPLSQDTPRRSAPGGSPGGEILRVEQSRVLIATVYTLDTAASEGHWHPVDQNHHACRPDVKGPAHRPYG